jgi:soluble lytic murein transglycosylase-like protein
MNRAELISVARAAALAHSLDPALVCAVCEQESAWNPWAIRYEPGFLARYVAPLFTAGKISATEAYARSFSWGLMQVMGQVAREHDFTGASVAQLCDPATGLDIGCTVLAHKFAAAVRGTATCLPVGTAPGCAPLTCADPRVIERALQLWNGGANSDYAAQVLARLTRYAAPPTS